MTENPIISLNDITYTWFGDDNPTLKIESLQIKKGEKVLIKGRSGSGKSTLLSLLSGVQVIDSGELLIKGENLKDMKAEERDHFRGNHIGYIFQQFNLLPYLTVSENILSPLIFSDLKKSREKEDHHTRVELLLNHLSLDVDPHKSVQSLSIGQQQRVAAARALIGEPEIIIADEPTSALDRETSEDLIQHLFKECERLDTTLIFVSHDDSLDSLFPRIIKIEEINNV